jgi:ribosomal protein S18 acetylase RimI-like enzyme
LVVTFTIRPARIEDARDIAHVQVESWKTTYAGIVPDAFLASLSVDVRTERWKEQLNSGTTFMLVAEDSTGVFGFASGGKSRETFDGYDAELYAIYLLEQKQRQGVGRCLVQKLAEALRANGFQNMMVWVLGKNPAVGFYKRLGASRIGEKQIEIGGVQLQEIAVGWTNLAVLL